jgi:hypothetical protein
MHCANPMRTPSRIVTSASPRACVARRSAETITALHAMSPTATAVRDRSTGPLMTSSNSTPTRPMGSDPKPTARVKRQSSVCRARLEVRPAMKARTKRAMSLAK